jgi:outer membrane protein assembly factor BamB
VIVYDALTGRFLWEADCGERLLHDRPRVLEIAGGSLFTEQNSRLRCFDARTGDPRRNHGVPGDGYGALAWVLARTEGRLYVGTQKGELLALNTADGAALWRHAYKQTQRRKIVAPLRALATDSELFVVTGADWPRSLAPTPGKLRVAPTVYCHDRQTGRTRWQTPVAMSGSSTGGVRRLLRTDGQLVLSVSYRTRTRPRAGYAGRVLQEIRLFNADNGKAASGQIVGESDWKLGIQTPPPADVQTRHGVLIVATDEQLLAHAAASE